MNMDIDELVALISKNTLSDIQRELRINAINRRTPPPESEYESQPTLTVLTERTQLLILAEKFLIAHPVIPENWESSLLCFEQLAVWFYTQVNTLPDAMTFSVLSWKMRIERAFSTEIYPGNFLLLGKAYFDEPCKWTAFLLWQLEKEVTPAEIVSSGILHQYFEFAIVSIEQIQQTYALLKTFDIASTLLKFLEEIPCSLSVFVNHLDDNKNFFQSYNLMAELFCHKEKKEITKTDWSTHKLFFDKDILSCPVVLFDLFGWDFIKLLNFENPLFSGVFHTLILERQDAILEKLANYTLTGELDLQTAEILLKQIALFLASKDTDHIKKLILNNPFYLHLLPFVHNTLQTFSPDTISDLVGKLISNQTISAIRHMVLLCKLCEFFELFFQYKTVTLQLKTCLFELLLVHDSMTQDNEMLDPVLELKGLDQFCRARILDYRKIIFDSIESFCCDEIDFDRVVKQWGSYLRHINTFLDVDPGIKKDVRYPYSIYALKALAIEGRWKKNNDNFDFPATIKSVCARASDEEAHCTLLESLLLVEDLALAHRILNELKNNDTMHLFLFSPIADSNSVLEHAIEHSHPLMIDLLKLITFTEAQSVHYLEYAWIAKNLTAMQFILQQHPMTQEIIETVLKSCYVDSEESDPKDYFEFNCQAVQLFYQPFKAGKYFTQDYSIYLEVLEQAIEKKQTSLVEYLCDQKIFLKKEAVDIALGYAYSACNWVLFENLCQTSHVDRTLRRVINALFFTAVENNQLSHLSQLLRLTSRHYITKENVAQGIKAATHNGKLYLTEQLQHFSEASSRKRKRVCDFFASEREEDEILLGAQSNIAAL